MGVKSNDASKEGIKIVKKKENKRKGHSVN
jgi:hypothetical protein